MKGKKIKHSVQCANNSEHIFEYVYTIVEGSEETASEVQAYCPYCDGFVDITIKGDVVTDDTVLRRFNL